MFSKINQIPRGHVSLSMLVSLMLFLAWGTTFVAGQATTGSVTGVVRDGTGAVIPGVQITVTEVDKGIKRATITNEEGIYVVPSLLPGKYQVEAEMTGFKKEVIRDVILQVLQAARFDITLAVGAPVESVTVEGGGVPLVQTEQGSLGEVIDEKKVQQLPLNQRRVVQLAALTAGAAPIPEVNSGASFTEQATGGRKYQTIQIGGGREFSTSFQIDGVEAVSWWLKNMSLQPSIDSIREFKVEKNAASAEFDRSQSVLNVSTKSGTNQLHGTAYEFHRNDNLDAKNFFAVDKGEFKQNQFGGTVGGPIHKDKTFFFLAYEGFRNRKYEAFLARVPTEQEIQGDFSGSTHPMSFWRPGQPIKDPTTGNPFPGNKIPSSRISPFATKHGALIPRPNLEGDPVWNFGTNSAKREDTDQFMFRIDHQLSPNHSIFGRYLWQQGDLFLPSIRELFGHRIPQDGQNALIQVTSNFSTHLINEFRVSYNRSFIISRLPEPSGGTVNYHKELGLKNVLSAAGNPLDFGVPDVNVDGAGITYGNWDWAEGGTDNFYRLADNATWVKGKHTLKIGGAYEQIRWQDQNNLPLGSLGFNGDITGNPLADYVLGLPISASGGVGNTRVNLRAHLPEVFLQDNWKVTSKLTLNFGIRYHYKSNWVDENDRIAAVDEPTGLLIYPKFPKGEIYPALADKVWPESKYPATRRSILDPDFNNFSPRLGFALRPFDDNNTVIRGGYGVFYDSVNGNEYNSYNFDPPFITVQNLSVDASNPATYIHVEDMYPSPFQSTPDVLIFTTHRRDKTPYIQQWNLAVQRKLSRDMSLELAYAGSAGRKLSGRWDPNAATEQPDSLSVQARRPWQQWGKVYGYWYASNSNYHAFSARLEKQFSAGNAVLANYTYSKSLDLTSKHNGVSDTYNRRASYGRSDFDQRQRLVVSYIQDLPIGRGRRLLANLRGPAEKLLGGWQINTIYTAAAGIPFQIGTNGANRLLDMNARRANRVGDGTLSRADRGPNQWFDTSAFVTVPLGVHGNSGRNILDAPGLNNVDFGLVKDTYITERARVEFRAEFFNLFNHTLFGHPGKNVDSVASFGRISSAGDAREVQFGLKVIF